MVIIVNMFPKSPFSDGILASGRDRERPNKASVGEDLADPPERTVSALTTDRASEMITGWSRDRANLLGDWHDHA